MKLVVLKMEAMEESTIKKAMKEVAGVRGLSGINFDMEAKMVTVTGKVDAVAVTLKLRKICHTELVSIVPVEKKEEKGKKKKKKTENNSNSNNNNNNCVQHDSYPTYNSNNNNNNCVQHGSYPTYNSYVDGEHEASDSECRIS